MYKLLKDPNTNEISTTTILRVADSTFIPMSEDNTDYQAYLKWVEQGGVPLPADE